MLAVMARSGTSLAITSLCAALAACAPPGPEAAPPIATVDTPAVAPPVPEAAPPAARPPEDPRVLDAALRCRRQRCANLGKACFDNCYRHGHPRDPEGHTRCNESCRSGYGVDACEAACEREAARRPR